VATTHRDRAAGRVDEGVCEAGQAFCAAGAEQERSLRLVAAGSTAGTEPGAAKQDDVVEADYEIVDEKK
jgi:hypothetical protein